MCRTTLRTNFAWLQGVVTFDGLLITANSTMNTTSIYGLNYTITFAAASVSGITSWDVAVNIRCSKALSSHKGIMSMCMSKQSIFRV